MVVNTMRAYCIRSHSTHKSGGHTRHQTRGTLSCLNPTTHSVMISGAQLSLSLFTMHRAMSPSPSTAVKLVPLQSLREI